MDTNSRIVVLTAQLPLQRLQLARQSRLVGQAVSAAVTSPATLAVAAGCGALLGWHWFGAANTAKADNPAAPVSAVMQQSLRAIFMAYLARSLA